MSARPIAERSISVREEGRERRFRIFFLLFIGLLTLLRLWLTRKEDIVGVLASGYDDSLYLELGEHAFWWRAPDDLSMLRLPAYPLWIWLCSEFGIPLYLGTTVLAISASLFLVYALRQIAIPRLACIAVYGAQLFEPNAIYTFRRVTPDGIYGILFVAVVSSILLVLGSQTPRQRWMRSAGLGVFLAVFVASRVESILCWVLCLLFLVAFMLQWLVNNGRSGAAFWPVLCSAALLPVIGLTTAPLAVALANKKAFGVFSFCSLTSAPFTYATNQLLSIRPNHDKAYVPVTRDARLRAYAISPAFAKLEPFLEGQFGARWGRKALERYGVPLEEIGGGWFFFAFRNSVAELNGNSPTRIDTYYRKVGRELDEAFKGGKLPRRHLWLSLVQPDRTIPSRVPASLSKILKQLLDPPPPGNICSFAARLRATPVTEQAFDRVTNRRSLPRLADRMTISGWAFSGAQPLISVVALKKDGASLPVFFENSTHLGVYSANKAEFPSLRPELPFAFSAVVSQQRKTDIQVTKFIFGDGTIFSLPVAKVRPGRFEIAGADHRQGWLRITAASHTLGEIAAYEVAARQLAVASHIYSVLFKASLTMAIPALVVFLAIRRSPQHNATLYFWFLPVFGFIAARLVVLALIDASSFNGAESRYIAPVAGPLAGGLILLFAQAIIVARSRFGRQAM
jgi:hypothetical protein